MLAQWYFQAINAIRTWSNHYLHMISVGYLLEEIIVELLLASMDILSDDAGILIFKAVRPHLHTIYLSLRVGEDTLTCMHPLIPHGPRCPTLHY